jgi:sugar lactone lactonase YvrE
VSASGTISTIAGTGVGAFSGDGGIAVSAQLSLPTGIALDQSGNIYIVDQGNNRIRKINTSGTISTVAGNGMSGYSGDGGAAISAKLQYPQSLFVDDTGNIYIAEGNNNAIRKVNPSGIITTIAGNSTPGFSGDGGPATAAKLNNPHGVAIDTFGSIFIADGANNRVREISRRIPTIASHNTLTFNDMRVYPNPSYGEFTVQGSLPLHNGSVDLVVCNIMGQVVLKDKADVQNNSLNASVRLDNGLPPGVYMLHIRSGEAFHSFRLVLER